MANGIDFERLGEVVAAAIADYLEQARNASDCGLPPECVPIMFSGEVRGVIWPMDKPEKPTGFVVKIADGFPIKQDG